MNCFICCQIGLIFIQMRICFIYTAQQIISNIEKAGVFQFGGRLCTREWERIFQVLYYNQDKWLISEFRSNGNKELQEIRNSGKRGSQKQKRISFSTSTYNYRYFALSFSVHHLRSYQKCRFLGLPLLFLLHHSDFVSLRWGLEMCILIMSQMILTDVVCGPPFEKYFCDLIILLKCIFQHKKKFPLIHLSCQLVADNCNVLVLSIAESLYTVPCPRTLYERADQYRPFQIIHLITA